jgi:hypothetical protein
MEDLPEDCICLIARLLLVRDRLRLAAAFPRFARLRNAADRRHERTLVLVSSASAELLRGATPTTALGAFLLRHRNDPTVRDACARHGVELSGTPLHDEMVRLVQRARDGILSVEDVAFWEARIDPSGKHKDTSDLLYAVLRAERNSVSQWERLFGEEDTYLRRALRASISLQNHALFILLTSCVSRGNTELALHLLALYAAGRDTYDVPMMKNVTEIMDDVTRSRFTFPPCIYVFIYQHVAKFDTQRTHILDIFMGDLNIQAYAECRGLPSPASVACVADPPSAIGINFVVG